MTMYGKQMNDLRHVTDEEIATALLEAKQRQARPSICEDDLEPNDPSPDATCKLCGRSGANFGDVCNACAERVA